MDATRGAERGRAYVRITTGYGVRNGVITAAVGINKRNRTFYYARGTAEQFKPGNVMIFTRVHSRHRSRSTACAYGDYGRTRFSPEALSLSKR